MNQQTYPAMHRRKFIKNTLLSSGGILTTRCGFQKAVGTQINSIGIQLFTLPKLMEENTESTLEFISSVGYEEVELYGPFPFSSEEAKERWKKVSPLLGFSGSGFYGKSFQEFGSLLKKYGLKATSTHTDIKTLLTELPKFGELSQSIGLSCVGIPSLPEEYRSSLDDYKRAADIFNNLGSLARKNGLSFLYHNHGYGLQELDGVIPMNYLIENTDPETVFFELDIFWNTAGRANPVDYLNGYPNRFKALHIKDMKELVHFSGDGGSPDQWMKLFPYMTTIGEGVLDIKSILRAAALSGVSHYYVEQDLVENPKKAIRTNFNNLNKMSQEIILKK